VYKTEPFLFFGYKFEIIQVLLSFYIKNGHYRLYDTACESRLAVCHTSLPWLQVFIFNRVLMSKQDGYA